MKRFWAIFTIISHFMVTSVLASAHAAEDMKDGCGSCIGYEAPHIHIQSHDSSNHDHESETQGGSEENHEHDHDESGHVHLIFQLSKPTQVHGARHQQVLNAAIPPVYGNMSFAPPVPPPTA